MIRINPDRSADTALVVMMLNRVTEDTNHEESCLKYFSNLLENKTINKEITALRQQVLGKITELSMTVSECNDRDALKTTSNHINSALMAIKAIQNISTTKKTLPIRRKIAPNKLSEKQPGFFSTKNKTTNKIKRISKPTYEQIKYSKSLLLKQEATCCGICFQENDTSNNEFVNWVQCSSCGIRLHVKCVTGNGDAQLEDFLCKSCTHGNPNM